MQIVLASGKGGTGKTTVATNLAAMLADRGQEVCYADCDVEEPNGHIFLKPAIERVEPVTVPVPEVDRDVCTLCGQCGQACQYHAIVCLGREVLTFPQMCHGCGACALVCPTGAITAKPRRVGVVEMGTAQAIRVVQGRLDIGEPIAPTIIRKVKAHLAEACESAGAIAVVDAPPGTSCATVQTVRGADYVLLVTEPTPFGLHDLKLAVEMARVLAVPFGILINRADLADAGLRAYCREQNIDVLAEIPDDRRIAEAYSRGELAVRTLGGRWLEVFAGLWRRIRQAVQTRTADVTGPAATA